MNYKFQVVSSQGRDYIVRHKEFIWEQIPEMAEYIQIEITDDGVDKVEITRWDTKTGERK